MTKPKTSIQSVNLDDLEREMRRIAVSRRSVGRAKLTRTGGRPVLVAPVHSSRDDKHEPPAENGLASERDPAGLGEWQLWIEPAYAQCRGPTSPVREAQPPSSRALALVVLCLLVTGGVGVAMMMRVGPMAGSGARAPAMGKDQASSQRVAHAVAQTPSPSDGSSTNPTQPLDVATPPNPAAPRDAVNPAETSMPVVPAEVPLPNPPQPSSAETATLDAPHGLATEAIKPDAAIIPKSEPEVAPLPPTRPRGLASTRTTSVRAAPPTGKLTPAASKQAVKTVATQSDLSANAAGASSFSIQLASSLSESEALATLSSLKKQFPDALRGGSVRRAEGNGNGVFYRVQAGPLSRDSAENACSRIKASGENCIVVRR